jgi:hypothetical protein
VEYREKIICFEIGSQLSIARCINFFYLCKGKNIGFINEIYTHYLPFYAHYQLLIRSRRWYYDHQ